MSTKNGNKISVFQNGECIIEEYNVSEVNCTGSVYTWRDAMARDRKFTSGNGNCAVLVETV